MALDTIFKVLNVQPIGVPETVRLSQGENGRLMSFQIVGIETDIPDSSMVTISGTKPDGVVYSALGSISSNVVTIQETTQMTAAAGEWDAKIQITKDGNMVATARIHFVIDADPVVPGSVPSDSQLEGLVAQAQNYATIARGAAYGSPLTASTAAAMTDKTRVYVYTGSETGYTSGNWYYWNGSAWTSGGIYNSEGVETDDTLTVAGMPADAKATGDAIAEIPEGLSDEAKNALLVCFAKVAWTDANGQSYYDDLQAALYGGSNVVSISAVFTQGTTVIYDTDDLDVLRPLLTVTATYRDQTTEVVTAYTLNGTLTEGGSTITVTYAGKTATFNVAVTWGYKLAEAFTCTQTTGLDLGKKIEAFGESFTIGIEFNVTGITPAGGGADMVIIEQSLANSFYMGLQVSAPDASTKKIWGFGLSYPSGTTSNLLLNTTYRAVLNVTYGNGSQAYKNILKNMQAGTQVSGTSSGTRTALPDTNFAIGKTGASSYNGFTGTVSALVLEKGIWDDTKSNAWLAG